MWETSKIVALSRLLSGSTVPLHLPTLEGNPHSQIWKSALCCRARMRFQTASTCRASHSVDNDFTFLRLNLSPHPASNRAEHSLWAEVRFSVTADVTTRTGSLSWERSGRWLRMEAYGEVRHGTGSAAGGAGRPCVSKDPAWPRRRLSG